MKKYLGAFFLLLSLLIPVNAIAVESGWWWNPSESGRGYSIEIQGNNLFMAGYFYAEDGRATWLISGGAMTNASTYSGPLLAFGNGQTLTGSYQANTPTNLNAGTITLQFSDASHGTLTWPGGAIPIERFRFGAGRPSSQAETGWWWNAAESGRGFFVEVQGSSLFMAGYMYDSNGMPIWYIAPSGMFSANHFQGSWLQLANGQTLSGIYRPPAAPTSVGSMSLQFNGASAATLTLPNARQVSLTRFIFSSPQTTPKANLTPYQRTGWSDKIVVARTSGVTTDSTDLLTSDMLYISWAVLNNGAAATSTRNYTQLYLDGVAINSWYDDPPTDPDYYFSVRNYSIGSLPPGTHTLQIVADATAAVDESDETDNEYTKTFTVRSPAPAALGSMTWTVGNQCSTGAEIDYKFYDFGNKLVWPSSSSYYYINYGQTQSARLSCVAGAKICMGARSGSLYWGVNLEGDKSCTNCCYFCDGGNHSYTFGGCPGSTTPPPPPPPSPSCPSNIGTLNIQADSLALIYINGVLGGVGQAIMQLPAGSYSLSVRDTNNRQCYSQTVYVAACKVNEYRSNAYCRAF